MEPRQPKPAVEKLLGAIYGFVEKASTFTGSVDGSLFQFTVLPVGALAERGDSSLAGSAQSDLSILWGMKVSYV